MTLIEPFLAILPAPLQCLRIGPLASPATYTARDWFITNVLCMWVAYLYFALNYKQSSLCGPPDGWVWNTEKLIGGVMRRYPSWGDDSPSCDEYPQTVYEELLIVQLGKDSLRDSDKPAIYVGIIFVFVFPLLMTCLMLCMKRKLPGWGEPPADHAPAPDKNGGKLGMAKKVANAAMCAYSTASEVGGGVSAVGSSLDVAGVSLPPKLGVADVAGVAASKIQQQV